MTPMSVALLLAAGAIAGFFGMRALVGACMVAQRRRLREDAEFVTGGRRRPCREEAAALLLPLRA